MQKAAGGHFEHAVWIDITSTNMSCFFTIIKTVSISCNWTDQLLFTYKIALCTSHSQSFTYGRNILIKFMHLRYIYTLLLTFNRWKIQENMPCHFLEILVFLGGCFLCRTLYSDARQPHTLVLVCQLLLLLLLLLRCCSVIKWKYSCCVVVTGR